MLSIDVISYLTFLVGTSLSGFMGLLIGIVSWRLITKRKYEMD